MRSAVRVGRRTKDLITRMNQAHSSGVGCGVRWGLSAITVSSAPARVPPSDLKPTQRSGM